MKRIELDENTLENINGGFMNFDPSTMTLTFIHGDMSTTTHTIIDYDNAWYYCNQWHAKNWPEEDILKCLIEYNFVK